MNSQRRRKTRRRTTTTETPVQDEIMNMLEADEMTAEEAEAAEISLENGKNEVRAKQLLLQDPCIEKHCGAGRICKVRRSLTGEKTNIRRR